MSTYKSDRTGLTGTLKQTTVEGANYRWVPCLALLDSTGRWLYSAHWRTNHRRKAHRELIAAGFTKM